MSTEMDTTATTATTAASPPTVQDSAPTSAPGLETNSNNTTPTTAAQTADIPPNQTLYVNNINEKIKKDELKKTLYLIFSAYGNIVEINCHNTYRMRGQAWIVFDQLQSASRAHRELQNFLFFGKPLRITFAKTKSDTIARLDGTFQQRQKRKAVEDPTKPKKGGASAQQQQKRQKTVTTSDADKKKRVDMAEGAPSLPSTAAATASVPPPPAPVTMEPPPPPHRILFVENLPSQANELMLSMLFQQYPGYKESRVIPGKNVAFVEFDEIFQATTAMEALQGFKITQQNLMKITYAKQ